jgi:hypothetical protein
MPRKCARIDPPHAVASPPLGHLAESGVTGEWPHPAISEIPPVKSPPRQLACASSGSPLNGRSPAPAPNGRPLAFRSQPHLLLLVA